MFGGFLGEKWGMRGFVGMQGEGYKVGGSMNARGVFGEKVWSCRLRGRVSRGRRSYVVGVRQGLCCSGCMFGW